MPAPHAHSRPRSCKLPNALASLVMGSAIGVAYFNCDPMIAGSEPTRRMAALQLQPKLALPALPNVPVPAPAEPGATPPAATAETAPVQDGVLTGRWAIQMSVALLERGLERLEHVSSYTFTLTRQERVRGDLLPPQTMDVKLRHEPFSLYMKWIEGEGTGVKGRQLIYVQGQNDGKLLVLPGGLGGRLTGTMSLAIDDPLVTAESRHPVNECGLKYLAQTLLGYQKQDLATGCKGFRADLFDDQIFNDRPCFLLITTYDSPERSPEYRKAAIYIDKELSLPIGIRNFTWGQDIEPEQLDEMTLVESYSYSEILIDTRQAMLADEDFSRQNPKYRMKR